MVGEHFDTGRDPSETHGDRVRQGLDSWVSISPVVPFTQGFTSIGSERITWVIARGAGDASSFVSARTAPTDRFFTAY